FPSFVGPIFELESAQVNVVLRGRDDFSSCGDQFLPKYSELRNIGESFVEDRQNVLRLLLLSSSNLFPPRSQEGLYELAHYLAQLPSNRFVCGMAPLVASVLGGFSLFQERLRIRANRIRESEQPAANCLGNLRWEFSKP